MIYNIAEIIPCFSNSWIELATPLFGSRIQLKLQIGSGWAYILWSIPRFHTRTHMLPRNALVIPLVLQVSEDRYADHLP